MLDRETAVCCLRGGPGRLSYGDRLERMMKEPCFCRQVLLTGIMKKNWIREGSWQSSLSQRCSQCSVKMPFTDFDN